MRGFIATFAILGSAAGCGPADTGELPFGCQIQVEPHAVDLGWVPLEAEAPFAEVTLTNVGDAACRGLAWSDGAHARWVGPRWDELAPGGARTRTVSVLTSTAGLVRDVVSVSAPSVVPAAVEVSAELGPAFSVAPERLEVGDGLVGCQRATTLVLDNRAPISREVELACDACWAGWAAIRLSVDGRVMMHGTPTRLSVPAQTRLELAVEVVQTLPVEEWRAPFDPDADFEVRVFDSDRSEGPAFVRRIPFEPLDGRWLAFDYIVDPDMVVYKPPAELSPREFYFMTPYYFRSWDHRVSLWWDGQLVARGSLAEPGELWWSDYDCQPESGCFIAIRPTPEYGRVPGEIRLAGTIPGCPQQWPN